MRMGLLPAGSIVRSGVAPLQTLGLLTAANSYFIAGNGSNGAPIGTVLQVLKPPLGYYYIPGLSADNVAAAINNGSILTNPLASQTQMVDNIPGAPPQNAQGVMTIAEIAAFQASTAAHQYAGNFTAGDIAFNGIPLDTLGTGPSGTGEALLGSGYANPGLSVNGQPISLQSQESAYWQLTGTQKTSGFTAFLEIALASAVTFGAADIASTLITGASLIPSAPSIGAGLTASGDATGSAIGVSAGSTPDLTAAGADAADSTISLPDPLAVDTTAQDTQILNDANATIDAQGTLDAQAASAINAQAVAEGASTISSGLPSASAGSGLPSAGGIPGIGSAISGLLGGKGAGALGVGTGASPDVPLGLGGNTSSLLGWGVLIVAMVLIIRGST